MTNTMKYTTLFMLSASTIATAAHAQAAPAEPASAAVTSTELAASSNPDGLGEIVVTAQKRETLVQRTPTALTALTGDQLRANGVSTLEDLSALAPSVSFSDYGGSTVISVRGVSSRDVTEVGDPAVAVSIDGQYEQRAFGLSDTIFDLERVEVLRGPQGTLFGRNTTGGAINFITAKPKKELGGYVRLTAGNYNLITAEAAANIPLTDWAQLRVSGYSRKHDGYRDNSPSADGDDADAQGARVHLALQPTDRLSVLLTGEYVHLGGVGSSIYGTPFERDADGNVIHEMPDLPDHGKSWPLSKPDQYLRSDSFSQRATVDYDLDFAKITYIGTHRFLNYNHDWDLDGQEALSRVYDQHERLKTWTHELRIASSGNTKLGWQAGVYTFSDDNDINTPVISYNAAGVATPSATFDYPAVKATSKAAFGQASYEILDNLRVEGGIRYTKDKKSRDGNFIIGSSIILPRHERYKGDQWTYHAGLNYQLTPRNFLYAKFDTGYKAGGFTNINSYGPEKIKAYEIGSKNRFANDTLQLNASAFYYDYKGQQISQMTGGDGSTTIFNAGASRVYGGEIEGVARITRNDQFDATIAYLHARFTSFCTTTTSPCPVANDFSGNPLPQAPDWQLSGGYQHEFHFGDRSLVARVQTRYEAKSYLTFQKLNSEMNPSYTRTDVTVTYHGPNDHWSVEGWVKNLENSRVIVYATESASYASYTYQFAAPRTFGGTLSVNW